MHVCAGISLCLSVLCICVFSSVCVYLGVFCVRGFVVVCVIC